MATKISITVLQTNCVCWGTTSLPLAMPGRQVERFQILKCSHAQSLTVERSLPSIAKISNVFINCMHPIQA